MNVTNLNNYSTYQLPNATSHVSNIARYIEPGMSQIVRLVVFSVIIFASLIGNTLVLKAVLGLSTRYKPFTYYLVANLAAAEIISSLCIPFIMVYHEMSSWIFGQFACKLLIPLQVMAVFVVTGDMAVIAVYRYRVMATPLKKKVKRSVMAAVIGGIWLVALALSLPLFLTRILVELPSGQKYCLSKFPASDRKIYTVLRFALSFILPYLVMVWSYGAVALKLKRCQFRRNVDETSEITMTTTTLRSNSEVDSRAALYVRPATNRNSRPGHESSAELERDLLRMIYVIIASFVVCYIPYQILFLWEYFTAANDGWQFPYQALFRKYFYVLTCLPSAIHPLCYGTMNRFFARAFSKIVMCRR